MLTHYGNDVVDSLVRTFALWTMAMRKARSVPFARRRMIAVVRVFDGPPANWPKHLRLAQKILVEELRLDDANALSIVAAAFQAAHACARAEDKRSRDAAYFAQRLKVRGIFQRIANCARRSPAKLRRDLNDGVESAFHDPVVDEESLEKLFDNLPSAFASAPRSEVSQTVLRAMLPKPMRAKLNDRSKVRRFLAESTSLLKQEYAALHPIDQRKVEAALTRLWNRRGATADAANVSETIAKALKGRKVDGIRLTVHDLVTKYAATVAHIWNQHGVKPVRSASSTFHRFVDIVLIAAVEPWSKRHAVSFNDILAEQREIHRSLPKDLQRLSRPTPRRSDIQWLVTDDHVKKAIRLNSKIRP
jgi:hypothetical protein